jgi:nucleoside-diphosphate-sugar epimerase
MKVVVTGGSGQLGIAVTAELVANGHSVVSLDRMPHPGGFKPAWTVDLRESGAVFEACCGADGMVHLAAHVAPGLTSDCATFNDNVMMTYNALKAAYDCRLRNVVIASSIAAYGFIYGEADRVPEFLPLTEQHPCRPTDPYGLSKVAGEMIADSFALKGIPSIASLRLPGVNYDLSYQRIASFMLTPELRKSGFWTYIDVRDAARACRLALERGLAGHRIFNVAAPTNNMREPTPELISRFFPSLREIRGSEPARWSCLDSSQASAELGFTCEHVWETYLT